jgi:hypothetical protein
MYFVDPSFEAKKWECYFLPVPDENKTKAMVAFCIEQARVKDGLNRRRQRGEKVKIFNRQGFCFNFIPIPFQVLCFLLCCRNPEQKYGATRQDLQNKFKDVSTWFCSEFVVACLQLGGYFLSHDACDVSPRCLRDMISEIGQRVEL